MDEAEGSAERFEGERELRRKAQLLAGIAGSEDSGEIQRLTRDLDVALAAGNEAKVKSIRAKLEDILFYLEDA